MNRINCVKNHFYFVENKTCKLNQNQCFYPRAKIEVKVQSTFFTIIPFPASCACANVRSGVVNTSPVIMTRRSITFIDI